MNESGAEMAQPIQSQEVSKPVDQKPSLVQKLGGAIRRVFSRAPKAEAIIAPVQDTNNLEAAKKELDNLMEMRTKGGADFNTPATRALDDKRMEELNTFIAKQTPEPTPTMPEAQPATITQFPVANPEAIPQPIVQPPAEEQKAA